MATPVSPPGAGMEHPCFGAAPILSTVQQGKNGTIWPYSSLCTAGKEAQAPGAAAAYAAKGLYNQSNNLVALFVPRASLDSRVVGLRVSSAGSAPPPGLLFKPSFLAPVQVFCPRAFAALVAA